MAQMILMKNGRPEPVISPADFEDLIDKHMGYESANYYHHQIKELSECIRELSTYINDRDIQKDIEGVLQVNGFE